MRGSAEVGRWIAKSRLERALTQRELAEWVDVDRTTIVRLEAGRASQVERLIDVLGVLGLDLVIVPRTAHVVVQAAPGLPTT